MLKLFNENISEINWERIDRVDDYACDCSGYKSCDEYEIYSVIVVALNGKFGDIW